MPPPPVRWEDGRTAYEVLGCPPGARQDLIKETYQVKARMFHADGAQADSEEEMKALNWAYQQCLQTEEKRAAYDARLKRDPGPSSGPDPAEQAREQERRRRAAEEERQRRDAAARAAADREAQRRREEEQRTQEEEMWRVFDELEGSPIPRALVLLGGAGGLALAIALALRLVSGFDLPWQSWLAAIPSFSEEAAEETTTPPASPGKRSLWVAVPNKPAQTKLTSPTDFSAFNKAHCSKPYFGGSLEASKAHAKGAIEMRNGEDTSTLTAIVTELCREKHNRRYDGSVRCWNGHVEAHCGGAEYPAGQWTLLPVGLEGPDGKDLAMFAAHCNTRSDGSRQDPNYSAGMALEAISGWEPLRDAMRHFCWRTHSTRYLEDLRCRNDRLEAKCGLVRSVLEEANEGLAPGQIWVAPSMWEHWLHPMCWLDQPERVTLNVKAQTAEQTCGRYQLRYLGKTRCAGRHAQLACG